MKKWLFEKALAFKTSEVKQYVNGWRCQRFSWAAGQPKEVVSSLSNRVEFGTSLFWCILEEEMSTGMGNTRPLVFVAKSENCYSYLALHYCARSR